MIIDTHIHLDDERYNEDIDEVLNRAREAGIERFIIPGADPKNLKRAQELSHANEDVFYSIGVHPYDMENYDEAYLESFADDLHCLAVGECGLDYFRLPEDIDEIAKEKAEQKRIFRAQIALAKRLKKPLIVHILVVFAILRFWNSNTLVLPLFSAVATVIFVASNTLPVAFVAFNPRFLMLRSLSTTVIRLVAPEYTSLSRSLLNPTIAFPELTNISLVIDA